MNPFLESTVAKSVVPIARQVWRRRQTSLGRMARVAGHAARIGVAGILCSPALAAAIDINSASLQQLQAIKGIGPKTAQIILDERQRGGDYESVQDLSDRVKGIGPKKAASLQAQGLSVGSSQARQGSGAAASKEQAQQAPKTPVASTTSRSKPSGAR